MTSAGVANDPPPKAPPGASWKDQEQQVLPKNRFAIVFPGLMLSVFLAALDQSIVTIALPSIVAELGGGNNYGWVGSAYMLASATFGPVYGKLANILGRKPVLYSCILIFLIGSALCGAAQSMTWLIVSRAIQGLGGGGIIQLVQITISDIVSLKDRGKYGGAASAVWATASVVGPLVGGALTQHVSWRWCFWINLPTGGVAGTILFFFLNLNPHQGRPFRDHVKEFDFIGLITIAGGVVCLLLGLNSGETAWRSAETIALLVVGGVLLIAFGINEMYTKRSPIIPPRLFKTRTTSIILISVLLHSLVFFTGLFYLPMYYQVLGASPTLSGVKLIPYSLGPAILSALTGALVTRTGSYRPVIWVGWTVMTLGWGLMIMLDSTSSIAAQEIIPLVTALGIGCLLQTPLIGLQAAMPIKDMATSTGSFVFLRQLGGAIGIAVGEAIISTSLPKRLKAIGDITIGTSSTSINDSIEKIASIPNVTLRRQVLQAYARSIGTIWIVNTPISAIGLILVVFIRAYSLNRNVIREGERKTSDPEKAEPTKSVGDDAHSQNAAEGTSHSADVTERMSHSLDRVREKVEA